MWRFLAEALLVLAPAQEDPGAWIEKLGSERFEEREAATAWLSAHGDAALDELRRLAASDDPEVQLRASTIVAAIEARQRRERLYDPYPQISLAVDEVEAAEVLQQIREQTGYPFRMTGVPLGRPVTAQFENASILDAILEVCRLHGGISFPRYEASVQAGAAPRFTVRHERWLIVLRGYQESAHRSGRQEVNRSAYLEFGVAWETRAAPRQVGVVLEEVLGSDGGSYVRQERAGYQDMAQSFRGPAHGVSVWLSDPIPRDVEAISVAGAAVLRYATEEVTQEIPWPGAVNAEVRIGDLSFRAEGTAPTVDLRFDEGPMEAVGRLQVVAVGADGTVIAGQRRGSSWSEDRMIHMNLEFSGDGDEAAPTTLRFIYASGLEEVRIPFRFDRVPMRPE